METKKYVVSDGTGISYIDQGKGTPILFVPGWGYSARVFERQLEALSKDYRVILIDPRCHGASDLTLKGISFEQYARDMAELIRALSLDNYYLVGWSYGAYVTWGIIRELGTASIRGVINIDQPPKCLIESNEEWAEFTPEIVDKATASMVSDEALQKGAHSFLLRSGLMEQHCEEEIDEFMKYNTMPREYAVAEFVAGTRCDYRTEATLVDRNPNCKGCMIVREEWSEKAVPYMKELCPDSEVVVLGGHMAFWEYAIEFNQIIKSIIER